LAHFSRGLALGCLLGIVLLSITWGIVQLDAETDLVRAASALPAAGMPAGPAAPLVTPAATVASAPTAGPTAEPAAEPTAKPTAEATVEPSPVPAPTDTPRPPTAAPAATATSVPATQPIVLTTPPGDCRQEPGVIERGTFYSATIGRDRPYRIYLPPCYRADGPPLPVVYMLHGSVQNDSQWDDDGLDEAATAAIQAGTLAPFVIAMPAGDLDGTYNYSSGGPTSFEGVMLADFLPFIEGRYRVRADRGGRAIGGLSRGAVWALVIAFRHPDQFLSVGSHSGAQSVAIAPPVYHPLELAAQASGLEQLRIYMDTGETDWYRSGVDELHARLTAREIPHVYLINPGTHDDAYWRAHVGDYVAFYAAPWSLPEGGPARR
jgi:enterochelin esterase-like enzyme